MKVRMDKIVNIMNVYDKIKTKSLPIKQLYKFSKFFNKLEDDYNFYQSKFSELISKYASRTENGDIEYLENGNIRIKRENIDIFSKQFNDLSSLEINIDSTFKLEDFDGLDLTMEELNRFIDLIEE